MGRGGNYLFFAVSTALMSTAFLVPGSFTYSNFGGGAWAWVGVAVTFDFSTSDKDECIDPRLPENASESIRGKKRDLGGVVVGRFCAKFGVERVGVGGRIAGDSLRECGFATTRPDERLRARGREVGVGGGDGTTLTSSEDRGVASPWKTFITDHLLRLRMVLLLPLLPLLCDTDSEVRGRNGSSTVSRGSIKIACCGRRVPAGGSPGIRLSNSACASVMWSVGVEGPSSSSPSSPSRPGVALPLPVPWLRVDGCD